MQEAIKPVRPAFQAFYNSLDDKQKAAMDATGPRAWGLRNWRWPWDDEKFPLSEYFSRGADRNRDVI